MLSVSRSGPTLAAIAAQVRDIPARVIPYAASTAATKSAQAAQRSIVAAMPRVFDRPTPFVLGSTRVVPSTVQTLAARVAVKDFPPSGGVAPQSPLLPEVEGGVRSEKRIERALRYAGILQAKERVVFGQGAELDSYGNLSGATVRGLLRDVQALQRGGKLVAARHGKKGASGNRVAYFAGPVGRKGTRGIWRREGRTVLPILIFTTARPTYRSRLDFTGIAEEAARATFADAFADAAEALISRRSTAA